MDNIQTGLQQTISLKVFFVENSLDLIILIKPIISCQLFYRERKHIHQNLNLNLLQLLIIFVLISPKFLLQQFVTKYFHVYILKLIDDNCFDLVSCSFFQTIQELSGYHAPIY